MKKINIILRFRLISKSNTKKTLRRIIPYLSLSLAFLSALNHTNRTIRTGVISQEQDAITSKFMPFILNTPWNQKQYGIQRSASQQESAFIKLCIKICYDVIEPFFIFLLVINSTCQSSLDHMRGLFLKFLVQNYIFHINKDKFQFNFNLQ